MVVFFVFSDVAGPFFGREWPVRREKIRSDLKNASNLGAYLPRALSKGNPCYKMVRTISDIMLAWNEGHQPVTTRPKNKEQGIYQYVHLLKYVR